MKQPTFKESMIETTPPKLIILDNFKKCVENDEKKIVKYNNDTSDLIIYDIYIDWSDKSKDVPFKSTKNCIGSGEKKLAREIYIETPMGGQNSTIDLIHPILGSISVKNMTTGDCILGINGQEAIRKVFITVVDLFYSWIIKYKNKCELAEKFYNDINKKYGSSTITILEGIIRWELSHSNLSKLNKILNKLKKIRLLETQYNSLKSEYIDDIINSLGDKSLRGLLNECVRKEATAMTLIIVHKQKGWLIVKDISKLTCPRITRGAPRINYKFV